jgi:hypothetical protein
VVEGERVRSAGESERSSKRACDTIVDTSQCIAAVVLSSSSGMRACQLKETGCSTKRDERTAYCSSRRCNVHRLQPLSVPYAAALNTFSPPQTVEQTKEKKSTRRRFSDSLRPLLPATALSRRGERTASRTKNNLDRAGIVRQLATSHPGQLEELAGLSNLFRMRFDRELEGCAQRLKGMWIECRIRH